jgi:hypothetical protein
MQLGILNFSFNENGNYLLTKNSKSSSEKMLKQWKQTNLFKCTKDHEGYDIKHVISHNK